MSFFSRSGIESPPCREREGTFGPGGLPSCMRSWVTIDLSEPCDAPGSTSGAVELLSCSCSSLTIDSALAAEAAKSARALEAARTAMSFVDTMFVTSKISNCHDLTFDRLRDKLFRRHHRPAAAVTQKISKVPLAETPQ